MKLFWHTDSSGVCSFVQIHPYFFTIVSASIFLLALADFACTFMIFKKMLLCNDGFGKNYECHLILRDLGVSKKYLLSVLEIFVVLTFPAPCDHFIFFHKIFLENINCSHRTKIDFHTSFWYVLISFFTFCTTFEEDKDDGRKVENDALKATEEMEIPLQVSSALEVGPRLGRNKSLDQYLMKLASSSRIDLDETARG